ncbi:nucleoside hydrolase [Paenibacillus turpanensis]|uniref:nucleoside hydrolase n=1 Tax=Paenibacillus turpanensis TaxID=2689078 RepID=UPI00140DD45E|nr:nucleoside hydrolase [Paenibacillus turpanensis]
MEIRIPDEKKTRVIINTDAKNEVDDQFAIVHAVLTPSFELHGIIPAHFGDRKSATSLKDSHDETMLVLRLMGMEGQIRVEDGAEHAMPDEQTPVDSAGARFIIEEAMKDDERPLYIAFYGPLTDMASALLLEPRIADRDIKVIWIGGGDWPAGGWEYNLANDVHAANVIFKSKLELWQISRAVYRQMPVSFAELVERVYPHGEIGRYLVEELIAFNNASVQRPAEYRILGDSPAVGVILFPDCGRWSWKPAPELDEQMKYIHNGKHRPIRVYETMDARFIMEDFYAKLAQFHRKFGR